MSIMDFMDQSDSYSLSHFMDPLGNYEMNLQPISTFVYIYQFVQGDNKYFILSSVGT